MLSIALFKIISEENSKQLYLTNYSKYIGNLQNVFLKKTSVVIFRQFLVTRIQFFIPINVFIFSPLYIRLFHSNTVSTPWKFLFFLLKNALKSSKVLFLKLGDVWVSSSFHIIEIQPSIHPTFLSIWRHPLRSLIFMLPMLR